MSILADGLQATPYVRAELLLAAPKILQACFAATGDYFTWRLAVRVYGRGNVSLAALVLTICSPWQWFCSVRTLSNSLETTLTAAALSYWPWQWTKDLTEEQQKSKTISKEELDDITNPMRIAAFACILRPTNVIVWATISVFLLYRHHSPQRITSFSLNCILVGCSVLAISVGIDGAYYGEITFPPLKFLYFNIVKSLAVFYGSNRLDYYFTEGLPLLLTTSLLFAAFGLRQAIVGGLAQPSKARTEESRIRFLLATAVIFTVGALTCISHKEVRFIYPLLPILHVVGAKPMANLFHPFPFPAGKFRVALMMLALFVNIIIAGYVSFVHQRGVIDVMHFLRHEQEARLSGTSSSVSSTELTVGFLMPCHSTPWRSHLVHAETKAWALTCEPPIDVPMDMRATYLDEADVFYADPKLWIDMNMGDGNISLIPQDEGSASLRRGWPQYLVFFEHLEPTMNDILPAGKYKECWRGFNTHFHDDWRRTGDVLVWCSL